MRHLAPDMPSKDCGSEHFSNNPGRRIFFFFFSIPILEQRRLSWRSQELAQVPPEVSGGAGHRVSSSGGPSGHTHFPPSFQCQAKGQGCSLRAQEEVPLRNGLQALTRAKHLPEHGGQWLGHRCFRKLHEGLLCI